ncbi:hypothetical protein FA13DRAFT_625541 [Coprinellus micaceus]|uniref:Uncharacterized protein n=1 Tax=Coprinellus micaceus TaxID=71717 RepID=A0A4Y7T6K1_COPMI|nr:hypothetical protein FA13DRAFT_625541 [Coprinellus micaceus]
MKGRGTEMEGARGKRDEEDMVWRKARERRGRPLEPNDARPPVHFPTSTSTLAPHDTDHPTPNGITTRFELRGGDRRTGSRPADGGGGTRAGGCEEKGETEGGREGREGNKERKEERGRKGTRAGRGRNEQTNEAGRQEDWDWARRVWRTRRCGCGRQGGEERRGMTREGMNK